MASKPGSLAEPRLAILVERREGLQLLHVLRAQADVVLEGRDRGVGDQDHLGGDSGALALYRSVLRHFISAVRRPACGVLFSALLVSGRSLSQWGRPTRGAITHCTRVHPFGPMR